MNIRKVSKSDINNLLLIKPSQSPESILERLNLQEKGEVDYLLLEENGEPISFVLVKWKGKPSHLDYPDMEDLYTREQYRGKGWGSRLIKEVEATVKKRGFSKIGLAVNPTENSRAKTLYEKLGYKHDGKDRYLDGVYNGTEDWVIDLEKNL